MLWTKVQLAGLSAMAVNANGSCSDTTDYPLIAGQHYNVGSVEITIVGCIFSVKYSTQDGLCMKETHLHVGDDIPKTEKGNPKVGHFEHGDSFNPCTGIAEYGPFECDDDIHIAAHAVVDAADYNFDEGQNVHITPVYPGTGSGDDSYFDVMIDSFDGITFDTWCIDSRYLSFLWKVRQPGRG
jgi:hypothetical protein